MSKPSAVNLRLNMPQWQGGNEPAYRFGAELLAWLAPQASGPVETVSIPEPAAGEGLAVEGGVVGRAHLLPQARAARQAIERHDPARIVPLGGDCLVSLAPFAYLSERYGGELGVLWVDAHPDIMTPDDYPHAHAHVLGLLLGRGDREFGGEVKAPVKPSQ